MSAWGSLHEGRRSPLNSFCGLRKGFIILYKEKWRTNLISWRIVELFLSALNLVSALLSGVLSQSTLHYLPAPQPGSIIHP